MPRTLTVKMFNRIIQLLLLTTVVLNYIKGLVGVYLNLD